ncbi:MAG: SDR family NAD(P)-dependent oxidoreductase [Aquificae bacterium]|nr:SDR family NAD(P)-dependent oxidoreductase [Aquificota bacterium]
MRLFLTGVGSGLGKALALEALKRGYEVYALGRRLPEELKGRVRFERCDLRAHERIPTAVERLLSGVDGLELAVLNAGVLGELKDLRETALFEMQEVFSVNLWAAKVVTDELLRVTRVETVVAVSSGAARNCNRGWGAYAMSKAALNCLMSLYAKELPGTHFVAYAPGLVLTPMLEKVLSSDAERFPSVERIRRSVKLTPEQAAELFFEALRYLKEAPSGSFVDVRELPVFEEFLRS